MSCETLARRLEELMSSLRKNQSQLTADKFEKPLTAFEKSLDKFEASILSILEEKEHGADRATLNQRLASPAGRILQDEKAFSAFSKSVLKRKFTIKKTETLRQATVRFVELVFKGRLLKKAIKNFDLMIQEANRPEIDADDETQLLREISHIGSLDDDALELAFSTRYANEKFVRKIAAAAHLKITPKTKFPGIVKKLIPYARNTFANTSF